MRKLAVKGIVKSEGITYRSNSVIRKNNPFVIVIPGGPGINSQYLDTFVNFISKDLNQNALVLDLPNHASALNKPRLSFPDVALKMKKAIEFLSNNSSITLVGHSFGARLVCEIIRFGLCPSKIVLISLAHSYESSKQYKHLLMNQKANLLPLKTERDFQNYWKQIIPFYFYKKPSKTLISMLSQKTSWINNSCQTNKTPRLTTSVPKIVSHKKLPLLIVEGRNDLRQPDGNLLKLKQLFKHSGAIFEEMNCGHFPMLEKPKQLKRIINNFIDSCSYKNI